MRRPDEVLRVEPLRGRPDCEVQVPGSKSITNRALLVAALADGVSTLEGALVSDDTEYMAEACRGLGVHVRADGDGSCLRVDGCGGVFPAQRAELFVGNAGTAMRFLVAALCIGCGSYRIDGTPRMRERPIQDLLDALAQLGGTCRAPTGCPPVDVEAHGLDGGLVRVAGDKSSQFLSALLLVAPYARAPVDIEVAGKLVAPPYVDMTIGVMEAFGVEVQRRAGSRFRVEPQRYAARPYAIEPDASSAHYFLAAAALCGGRVRVRGLGTRSLQGDVRFVDVLERMGARVHRGEDFLEVHGDGSLRGVDVDLNAISDTATTVAVLAPFASSTVRIRNIAHVRLQESDRLRAVATELRRIGARVEELEDGLVIEPSEVHGADIETYDDHRIAMSFALAGLRVPGVGIRDPQCVRKTFPEFFERLEELRR